MQNIIPAVQSSSASDASHSSDTRKFSVDGQSCAIPRDVFRAYDIRGVIGEQLNEQAYFVIGRGLSVKLTQLGRKQCYIARDGRLTSETLAHALAQGLLQSGIDVIDLGMVATPVMYFATSTQGIDCGLMVTGSHNPANYNGIKIVLAGRTCLQADIDELYRFVTEGNYIHGNGQYATYDILPQYKARLVEDIVVPRRLNVVVDCGNGVAGPVVPEVLERLGCTVIPMYCEVDGHFPNHHPDPSVSDNLLDLQKAVLNHHADLGLAFDGDADRLGVITNEGEIIWPDRLMMFYVKHLLKKLPGATIVFDVKCSSHLKQMIESGGGIAKMCPTGHSIVKNIMKNTDAALAGEMSGHLFFKDRWYGFDDALYSACRFIELIAQSALPVNEQFNDIPDSINTPEIKIPISEQDKFKFMQHFCQDAHFPEGKMITIDGLRVEFPHGWGLIRASNTTPCLVARFEAVDDASLTQIKSIFKQELIKIKPDLAILF